ncbi:MAG: membrane dipeptidase, partial [Bryobacteraceae bacterium]
MQRVHKAALIIDTHNDVPIKTLQGYDIATPSPKGSTDVPRLKQGNVGATFFAAYVPGRFATNKTAAAECRKVIGTIRNDIVAKHPNEFVLAKT